MQEKQRKQFIIVKSLVVNKQGRILFVKREREWHKEAHNKWELPGGKVDFGEHPEETADREAKQILICYVCSLVGGEKSLKDHGVNCVKWFDKNKIPKKSECLPGTIGFLGMYLDSLTK